jgi:hypothetical protein
MFSSSLFVRSVTAMVNFVCTEMNDAKNIKRAAGVAMISEEKKITLNFNVLS